MIVRIRLLAAWFFLVVASLPGAASNLVPNSSFECGAGRGWQMAGAVTMLRNDIVTGGFHGSNCLALTSDKVGISPPLWLTAGVKYTFSWYEKGNQANSFHYEIWKTKDGGGGTGAWVTMPTSWARRSVQYTPGTSDYYQIGWLHYQPSMTARIDALQVEVGPNASPYAPQSTLEAAMETAADHNTFFLPDTKQVQVKWWNEGPATTNAVLYEIFDLWNRKQASGFLKTVLPPGATTSTIPLPTNNGWLRITTRIPTTDRSQDELTCAVLPYAPESGTVSSGILGTHTENNPIQISYLRKLGFKWTRTLSPSSVFRWQALQPTESAYVWNDAGVTAIAGNGMMVMGSLNGGIDFTGGPAWAHNPDGSMKLDKWAAFCTAVVHRYKSQVSHWEIWNEPQQSGTPWIQVTTNYAAMLTSACAAIKAEDPTAKIVAIGGAFDEIWAKKVWDMLSPITQAQIDYISCHLYPADNSTDQNALEYDARHSRWREAFAGIKPVWNTETGTWGHGGMLTENAIWAFGYQPGWAEWQRAEASTRSRVSVDRISRNFLRSLGHGFSKYFYYDSRKWSQQAVTATQPYSWEYTGSLRPILVSLLIANYFIGQHTSVTRPTNAAAALEVYLFETGSSRVAAAFNMDRVSRDITTTETAFTVYDVMGTPVPQPSGKIRVTKTPQYIVSSTLSVEQMTTILQGSAAIVPDTNGPNISIDIAPSGRWAGGAAMLKWTAIDEGCVNSASYSNNITFAWKLDNGSYPPFGPTNFMRTTISAGNHILWVKAKDRDGNVSETHYDFEPALLRTNTTLARPANLKVAGAN